MTNMKWTVIKSAMKSLAKLAYDQGYITEKAYKQIISALG